MSRGQQYAGFRELGAGQALGSGMTRREAAELLAEAAALGYGEAWITADELLADSTSRGARNNLVGAYRDAARYFHPDAETGDADTMARLTEARDLLAAT